uniref:Uncharacterized protein n=1 Tax=Pyxicephalus adspersus TaxID=30357 RepID=A0AAV2ZXH2_PYXAD|nr:TPA: hypothetical protein GDO54_018151 [Pyxicephalus adspersus]
MCTSMCLYTKVSSMKELGVNKGSSLHLYFCHLGQPSSYSKVVGTFFCYNYQHWKQMFKYMRDSKQEYHIASFYQQEDHFMSLIFYLDTMYYTKISMVKKTVNLHNTYQPNLSVLYSSLN